MAAIKAFTFFLALSATLMVDCSLLEMSQTLWAKLLSGGLAKVGQLDPLRVPVIKVDQSEGNTSYRMVLRDVEIGGLNDSILESVHVARGRLRSNLSELEAGYVSYTDLRGMDSIKYRFHTLLKQPRRQGADAEEDSSKQDRFERLREYHPKDSRLRNDQEVSGQQGRSSQYNSQYSGTQQTYQSGQYDSQYSRDRDGQYQQTQQGSHLGSSGQYDSQYSRDRDGQQTHQGSHLGGSGQYDSQYSRDRDGQYQTRQGSQYSRDQDSQVHEGISFGGSRQYDSQYSRVRNGQQGDQRGGSVQYSPQYSSSQSQHYEQSPAGSQYKASENYDSQFARFQSESHQPIPAVEYGAPPIPIPQHPLVDPTPPSFHHHPAHIQQSSESPKSQYEEIQGQERLGSQYSRSQYVQNPQVPLENSRVDFHSQDVTTEYPSTTSRASGQRQERPRDGYKGFRAHVDSASGSIYMRGRRIQTLPSAERSSALKTSEEDSSVIGSRYPAGVDVIYAESPRSGERKAGQLRRQEVRKDCKDESKDDHFDDAEVAASENSEARVNPSRTPLEDQPGYIDIVYADGKENGTVKHFGNPRIESKRDKKIYNLDDVMKDIRTSRGLIAHNMTSGESLTSVNAARKIALESRRLRDQIRYAENYQESEGYFEEGMQLIYHYGAQPGVTRGGKRTKRAHLDEESDEDVMHIILRIRVPALRVTSQYQLNGKVGQEILRGNGLLSGNFSDLVADFTVELKKTGDDLMIVRAARAKLLAGKKNVSLEGMDDKGPVSSIFNYGLMAAEAVAAMLADDLATKALTDKSADAMIYKMYKDLPAV